MPEDPDASAGDCNALGDGSLSVAQLVQLATKNQVLQRPERLQHPAVSVERTHDNPAGEVSGDEGVRAAKGDGRDVRNAEMALRAVAVVVGQRKNG